MNRSNTQNGLLVILIGLACIFDAIRNIILRRRMLNTATSKISSAHIGDSLEFRGKVHCEKHNIQISPISNRPCAAYILTFEQLVKKNIRSTQNARKKTVSSTEWEKTGVFYSNTYIHLQDGGKYLAKLNITECSFIESLKEDSIEFLNTSEIKENRNLTNFLKVFNWERYKNKHKGHLHSPQKFRIKESILNMNEDLYILGSTHSPSAPNTKDRKKNLLTGDDFFLPKYQAVKKFKQMYKKDRKSLLRFDIDANTKLSTEEVQRAYQLIQLELESDSLKTIPKPKDVKIIIGKSRTPQLAGQEQLVQVSLKTEEEVDQSLQWKILIEFIAAPVFIFVGAALLFSS